MNKDYESEGYSQGLTGGPSLPPSMKWEDRLAYERGYDMGRKARQAEREAMDYE